MNLRQLFIHHASEHLREPVINRGEQREDDAGDDVMKVRDDVVSIVNKNIDRRRSHEYAAKTADQKIRDKSQAKSIGEVRRMVPPHKVPSQLKTLMADGTAITMVVIIKAVPSSGFIPLMNM